MQRTGCLTILTAIAMGLCGCAPNAGKNNSGSVVQSSTTIPAAEQHLVATSVPSTADSTPDLRPVIVCFGDSITAGYGVEPAVNYPANLQRELDTRGYDYRVVNMGVSGETTKDGLMRVDAVLKRRPEWVIVEFGGNDGLRGLPLTDTQRNLTAIVAGLRRGGANVMVAAISLPTQYGPDYISRFNAVFPAVARQARVPLLPFAVFSKGVYGVDGNIQEDGIHPTASGDKLLAANVASALAPRLHKQP